MSKEKQSGTQGVARRTVLTHVGVVTAAFALGPLVPGVAAAAPSTSSEAGKTARDKAPASANGWPVEKEANHVSTVWTRPVPGTGLSIDIRIGDVEAILLHVIRRYHYEVERLHHADLAGWQRIEDLDSDAPESNRASGTAVRIRPGAAAGGSLFPLQEVVLRDILADCEGVVRWGGDDSPVDESLFYVDRGPADPHVRKLADTLREGEARPGQGAGKSVNVMAEARRTRANDLARKQRGR
ncbi:hypothetical protein [Streptomyces sp. SID11385]|uniref:hypothetical protein n=1 Tax=Streptomyces sp. SID11385 TaxID=2706031 RepID=UPI0013C9117A|nr:hypothetical protein [Streptomyces sp. SID11385]NEA44331.1 hypothetical protein [Streptomyces sp. SID11385]